MSYFSKYFVGPRKFVCEDMFQLPQYGGMDYVGNLCDARGSPSNHPVEENLEQLREAKEALTQIARDLSTGTRRHYYYECF